MQYKNRLVVNRDEEKQFYRICKELMTDQESYIEDASNVEWHGTLRKFGKRAKPLIEKRLLDPIWITDNRNRPDERLIKIPKNVTIDEIIGNKKSFFNFHKIKRRI